MMTQFLTALSVWLHSLAITVFIGYYLLLSTIFLPVLAQEDGKILSRISRRSRPWLYASLVIFSITGIYLTFIDSAYLGLGNFSNAWAILMLVKHLLVLVMIAAGFWFNAIQRVGSTLVSSHGAQAAMQRFRSHARFMTIVGILIILLTAISQVQ